MSYTVNFSGADGATITTGGAISGVRGTPAYEDTPSLHGSNTGRFFSGTTHSSIQCDTSPTTHTGSLYLYIPAENDTHIRLISFGNIANSTTVCNIRLKSNRVLSLANSATADTVVGTDVIPLNQWVRIDWHYDNSDTAAPIVTTRLFLDAEGSVHDEELTWTFTGTVNTFERINFGIVGTAAVTTREVRIASPIRVTDGIGSWPEPVDPPDPGGGEGITLWNGTDEIVVTRKLWNGTAEVALGDPEIYLG